MATMIGFGENCGPGPITAARTQGFRDARAQAYLYLPAIFPDLKPMFGK